MRIDLMTQSGAYIDIDVVYYYFTIDHGGVVTHVNFCFDSPDGPFTDHAGDFLSFKTSYNGYLFIPVPRGGT